MMDIRKGCCSSPDMLSLYLLQRFLLCTLVIQPFRLRIPTIYYKRIWKRQWEFAIIKTEHSWISLSKKLVSSVVCSMLHNMNNRDLFNLLEIVLDKERPLKETRDKAIEYTRENEVDKNVVMTVAGAANCRLDYRALVRKGDGNMCTVFEETWMEGKAEGKIVGIIKMLRKYKESDEKIISELVSELEVSESVAKEYLEQYNKGLL